MSAFAPDDGDTHDPFVEDSSTSPPLPQSSSLHSIHDPDASHRRSNNPLLGSDNLVSDLEQEVLDEYTRLLGNVNQVSELI
jgi:DASH complex subunit DAD3